MTGRAAGAADALAGFLRALGLAGRTSADAGERARGTAAAGGRRMLILLDNASAVEQVRRCCRHAVLFRGGDQPRFSPGWWRGTAPAPQPDPCRWRTHHAAPGADRREGDADLARRHAGAGAPAAAGLRVAAEFAVGHRPDLASRRGLGAEGAAAAGPARRRRRSAHRRPRRPLLVLRTCTAAARASPGGRASRPDLGLGAAAALFGSSAAGGRLLGELRRAHWFTSRCHRYGMHDCSARTRRLVDGAAGGGDPGTTGDGADGVERTGR